MLFTCITVRSGESDSAMAAVWTGKPRSAPVAILSGEVRDALVASITGKTGGTKLAVFSRIMVTAHAGLCFGIATHAFGTFLWRYGRNTFSLLANGMPVT